MKKIKKFNIQNIWSFLEFNWDNSIPTKKDKEWKPLESIISDNNIFYWDNWNGKSTLVKIFKKINWNDIEFEKHWEHEKHKIDEIKLEIFNEDWSPFDLEKDFKDKFIIFDKYFILDNVWDIVWNKEKYQTDNNKTRWEKIITLWWFNEKEKVLKKYEEIIKDLENKNIEFLNKIKSWWEKINNNLKNNKKISEYKELLEEINKFDFSYYNTEKVNKEKKFNEINEILKNFQSLQDLKELEEISEITFDKEKFEKTFEVPFIWVDFLYQEKEYIKELFRITNENNLDKCLFCYQKIKNWDEYIDKIKKLSDTFSTKEKEISDNLIELKNIITYLKQENKEIENLHIKNKLNFSNFSKFDSNFKYDETLKIDLSQYLIEFLKKLLIEIIEKNNVKSKTNTVDLENLDLFIKELNTKIKEFNKNIKSINTKIAELKKVDIESKKEEKITLETELNELQNKYFIKNNFETIKVFLDDYKKYEQNNKNIEILKWYKDEYRKKLSEEFKKFSEEYWSYIWDVLKELNSSLQIDFEIKNWTSNYSQWAWRYWFEIHYNNKNIIWELSEWEKRAIALSYFFAEIKKKIEDRKAKIWNEENLIKELEELKTEIKKKNWEDKKELWIKIGKINKKLKNIEKYKKSKTFWNVFMVLDDPAVDFDIWHKKIIADFIAKYSSEFKQTFIFSHDSLFVDYLKNSFNTFKSWNLKHFWIYKTNTVSNITENEKNVFDKYLEDIKSFKDKWTTDLTELYVLTYKLRFCIEKVIKDDVLWFWNSTIDSLISHIWSSEKFWKLKSKTEKLKSIYNFCNNNGSHFSDVEWWNNWLEKNIENFIEIYNEIQ